jgi:hypothetical protein
MFVCCGSSVLSGRGLCVELIIRPEESYELWPVVVCDHETLRARRPWPAIGPQSHANNKQHNYVYIFTIRNLAHVKGIIKASFEQVSRDKIQGV